jgi:hypothetical protein
MNANELAAALAQPFAEDQVEWKPQAIKGDRALAVPYIDARLVMDRLDQALGVGNWQTTYREVKDGILCTLSCRIHDEWVCHEDFGSFSDQPDAGDRIKAAASDGLKRCAVHLGIARYLYRVPSVWVDYDTTRKRFAKQPRLPDWAVPKTAEKVPGPGTISNGQPAEPHTFPEDGPELERRLADYDQDLAEQGLFAPGELLGHVLEVVSKAGPKPGATYGTDVRTWPARAIKLAIETTKAFEQRARAKAARKERTLNHIAGREGRP